MPDYHVVLGAAGAVLEFASMVPYFANIARGTTKPHLFTWFGWGLISAVVGGAQFTSNAGAGVLVTASIAFTCFSVAILALFRGEKQITKGDWVCITGSMFAIVLWSITHAPLIAVVIVSIADLLAYAPTVRKAYHKPHEETAITFALSAVRSALGIAALQSFAIVNWLYPASILISDGSFSIMLLVRRRQLARARLPV